MYIELFILDNFAFAFIILHTSKIISKLTLRKGYWAICALMTAISVFAMNEQWLLGLMPKIVMLSIMACSFKTINIKSFINAALCILLSTMIYGGMTYAFINTRLFGGILYAPVTLRWINYALGLCFIAAPFINKLFNAIKLKDTYQIMLTTSLGSEILNAKLDTGNSLMACSLPVIIVDYGQADKIFEEEFTEGMIYVPFCTVAGSGVLKAQRATVQYFENGEWRGQAACYIAKSKLSGCQALMGQKIISESGVTA